MGFWNNWKNLILYAAAGLLAVAIILFFINRDRRTIEVDPKEPEVEADSPVHLLDPFGRRGPYAAIKKDSTTYEQVEIEVPDSIEFEDFENVVSISGPDSTIAVTGLKVQSPWFPGFRLKPPQTVSATSLQANDSLQTANVTQSLSLFNVDLNSFGGVVGSDIESMGAVEVGINWMPVRIYAFHVGLSGTYLPATKSFGLDYTVSARVRDNLMLTVGKPELNFSLKSLMVGITYKIN